MGRPRRTATMIAVFLIFFDPFSFAPPRRVRGPTRHAGRTGLESSWTYISAYIYIMQPTYINDLTLPFPIWRSVTVGSGRDLSTSSFVGHHPPGPSWGWTGMGGEWMDLGWVNGYGWMDWTDGWGRRRNRDRAELSVKSRTRIEGRVPRPQYLLR